MRIWGNSIVSLHILWNLVQSLRHLDQFMMHLVNLWNIMKAVMGRSEAAQNSLYIDIFDNRPYFLTRAILFFFFLLLFYYV